MGLDVDESHFYTSALATAHFLDSQAPGCSAYVLGEHGITNALYDKGITYNDVNPDYVVVGESSAYNLEQVTKAIRLVNAGAKLIGTNPDLTAPAEAASSRPAGPSSPPLSWPRRKAPISWASPTP